MSNGTWQHLFLKTEDGFLTASGGNVVVANGRAPGRESVFTFEHDPGVEDVRIRLGDRYLAATPDEPISFTDRAGATLFHTHRQPDGRLLIGYDEGAWYMGNVLKLAGMASTNFIADDCTDPRPWIEAMHNCCGTERNEVGISWNDLRHQAILGQAMTTIRSHQQSPLLGGYAKEMAAFWDRHEVSIKLGLREADEKKEYTGRWWSYHFYDPETRDTINTLDPPSDRNAMTECLRYVYSSAGKRQTDPERAAYELGLALHFLTDLTQPMHAAKFANVLAGWSLLDLRHMGFENYADNQAVTDALARERPATIAESALDPQQWESPGQLVDQVARQAQGWYRTDLARELHRRALGFGLFHCIWGSEALPLLVKAILHAERMTAAFLLWWAAHDLRKILDRIYFRLIAPGRKVDDSGFATWGGRLLAGSTMKSIVIDISRCPEVRDSVTGTAQQKLTTMYHRLLGRGLDPTGLKDYAGVIDQRDGYERMLTELVESPEYTNRFGPHVLPSPYRIT